MSDIVRISVRGKSGVQVPPAEGVTVVSHGRFIKTGEVFDECWLRRAELPSYESLISELSNSPDKPDIFTFAQRVPDTEPAYGYHHEFDNYAVLPLSEYGDWVQNKVSDGTRRAILASAKRGVIVRVSAYDDDYVRGIISINNEVPLRGGRRFQHFGKDFETVKAANGTYADRSTFLAAFRGTEMVGYLKIVWDVRVAAMMEILSKLSARDCKPNNALMAEAVRQCCLRNVSYLLYGKFDYGRKTGDSLTRFKQNQGFCRMDVPRYYIPLTRIGAVALRLGLHRKLTERVPERIAAPLRNLRAKWLERSI